MVQRAALADATEPGPLLVAPDVVDACIAEGTQKAIRWTYKAHRTAYDLHTVARVAILRDASGASWDEIACRLPFTSATARRYYRIHKSLTATDALYAYQVGALLARAISKQFDRTEPGQETPPNPRT